MKNEEQVVASLRRFAKNLGIDVLSLPITVFAEDPRTPMPPAYTTADGIFLSDKVVEEEPENIDVFLAHEVFHHVIGDDEQTGDLPWNLVNRAEDYKINQFIKELWGYDVHKVKRKGLLSKKYNKLTVRQVASSLLHQHKHDEPCHTRRLAHPLILGLASRLREKYRRRLGLPGVDNYVLLDRLDLQDFYHVMPKVLNATHVRNLQRIDVSKVMRGLWSHLCLKKVATPEVEGSLNASQALVYGVASDKYRLLTVGKPEEAIVASALFLQNVDRDDIFVRAKVARYATAVANWKALEKRKLKKRSDVPNYTLRELRRRIVRDTRALQRWQSVRPLPVILKDDAARIPVLQGRTFEQTVTPSLRTQTDKVQQQIEYHQDVKLPHFDRKSELAKRLRQVSMRAVHDFEETMRIMRELGDLVKELGISEDEQQGKQQPQPQPQPGDEEEDDEQDARQPGSQPPKQPGEKPGSQGQTKQPGKGPKDPKKPSQQKGTSNKSDAAGTGQGSGGGRVDLLMLVNKHQDMLSRILQYMKEIESLMSQQNSTKAAKDRPNLHSFEFGNDINRVLPSELGLLGNDATKMEFLVRYANQTLLQLAPVSTKRYPVAVCIDGSGSMKGEFYSIAVAFTLVLAKQLQRDRRGMAIIIFSHNVERVLVFSEHQTVSLLKLLMTICTQPSYGGTDFDAPLHAAYDIKEQQRWKNMVTILVSDGYGTIRSQAALEQRKSVDDKIIAAIVSRSRTLRGVDELYHVKRSGMELEMAKIANEVI